MKSLSKIWIWLPLSAATVVGLIAPSSSAHALELTGVATLSARSGHAGTSSFTLGDPDSDTDAVYGIDVRERSDDPCLVTLGIEDLDSASSDDAPDLDLCGPNGPGNDTLLVTYVDTAQGGANDHTFIRAVSVCTDSNHEKVKGISLDGFIVASNGAVTNIAHRWDDHPNCAAWHAWQYCPGQQIATAMELYFGPTTGSTRSLTGIALYCRAIAP